jgi:hypothetical protein
MAHPSARAPDSALEIARRNRAASKRPLSPMMQTAVTARALAGDGKEKERASGAVPEASD